MLHGSDLRNETSRPTRLPGSLPPAPTPFVGRHAEIIRAQRQLGRTRLLTVTGPGGVGKTAFATILASHRLRAFPDGVIWVDASSATSLTGLVDALATSVQVATPALEAVVRRLGTNRVLVVLDNCEQITDAAATVCAELLHRCPHVNIIVTSRQSLRTRSESVLVLSPLSTRRDSSAPTSASEAATMFIEVAQRRGHALRNSDISAVEEISDRLEGIPLALELAAQRLDVLGPAEIATRLDRPSDLLTHSSRASPSRQRTMDASIRWSFELCTVQEQLLWKHLSVFIGGVTIDAIEFIGDRIGLTPSAALDTMQSLVEKSVLHRDSAHSGRFAMLSLIREWGVARLAAEGDLLQAATDCKDWCVQLLATAKDDWYSSRQAHWMGAFADELPNIRAAIEHCVSVGSTDTFLLLHPVWRYFWLAQGRVAELNDLLESGLAAVTADDELTMTARALHLYTSGLLGRKPATAVLSELRAITAEAVRREYDLLPAYGRSAQASLLAEGPEALALFEEVLHYVDAPALTEILKSSGTDVRAALMYDRIGPADRGAELNAGIAERSDRTGERFEHAYLKFGLAANALARSDYTTAFLTAVDSLALRSGFPLDVQTALSIELMAGAASAQGIHGEAAVYFGAADRAWADLGSRPTSFQQPVPDCSSFEEKTRAALAPDVHRRQYRLGFSLTVDALRSRLASGPVASKSGADAAPAAHPGTPSLTKREAEIARLAAEGMSNREIAELLVLSLRTVENHLQRAMVKLGKHRRSQLGAAIRRESAPNV